MRAFADMRNGNLVDMKSVNAWLIRRSVASHCHTIRDYLEMQLVYDLIEAAY